jgi:hypothetical protein
MHMQAGRAPCADTHARCSPGSGALQAHGSRKSLRSHSPASGSDTRSHLWRQLQSVRWLACSLASQRPCGRAAAAAPCARGRAAPGAPHLSRSPHQHTQPCLARGLAGQARCGHSPPIAPCANAPATPRVLRLSPRHNLRPLSPRSPRAQAQRASASRVPLQGSDRCSPPLRASRAWQSSARHMPAQSAAHRAACHQSCVAAAPRGYSTRDAHNASDEMKSAAARDYGRALRSKLARCWQENMTS